MIDHLHPNRRDKLAIALGKYAVLEDDDTRSRNEFQADGLMEEGLFFA